MLLENHPHKKGLPILFMTNHTLSACLPGRLQLRGDVFVVTGRGESAESTDIALFYARPDHKMHRDWHHSDDARILGEWIIDVEAQEEESRHLAARTGENDSDV